MRALSAGSLASGLREGFSQESLGVGGAAAGIARPGGDPADGISLLLFSSSSSSSSSSLEENEGEGAEGEEEKAADVVGTIWRRGDAGEVIDVLDVGTSVGDVGIDGAGSAMDDTSGADSSTPSGVWPLSASANGTFEGAPSKVICVGVWIASVGASSAGSETGSNESVNSSGSAKIPSGSKERAADSNSAEGIDGAGSGSAESGSVEISSATSSTAAGGEGGEGAGDRDPEAGVGEPEAGAEGVGECVREGVGEGAGEGVCKRSVVVVARISFTINSK